MSTNPLRLRSPTGYSFYEIPVTNVSRSSRALTHSERSLGGPLLLSTTNLRPWGSSWDLEVRDISRDAARELEAFLQTPGFFQAEGFLFDARTAVAISEVRYTESTRDAGYGTVTFQIEEQQVASDERFLVNFDVPKGRLSGLTFARTSVANMRVESANLDGTGGLLASVASGVPRIGHRVRTNDGIWRPVMLIEQVRTNLCLQSQTLDSATWMKTRTTVSANADTAPDGTLTADRLIEDATAASGHYASQGSIAIAADAPVVVSQFMRAGPRTWALLVAAGGGNQFGTFVDLAAGALGSSNTVGTGVVTRKRIVALANGWYWVEIVGTVGSGATAIQLNVYIAEADNDATFYGDGASYISVWGAQLENNVQAASSYIATTTASVARGVESLSVALPDARIRSMSGYVSFVEGGTAFHDGARVFQLGDVADTPPRVILFQVSNGQYRILLSSAAANASLTLPSGIVLDDYVRIWWRLVVDDDAGTMYVEARQRVNGGAWSDVVTGSTIAKDATDWSDDVLHLGGRGTSDVGLTGIGTCLVDLDSMTAEDFDDHLALLAAA